MGVIVLGRKYTPSKYLSVLMITIGTIICTFASAEHVVSSAWMITGYGGDRGDYNDGCDVVTQVMVIMMVTFFITLH